MTYPRPRWPGLRDRSSPSRPIRPSNGYPRGARIRYWAQRTCAFRAARGLALIVTLVAFCITSPSRANAVVGITNVATSSFTSGNDCSIASLDATTGGPNLIILAIALHNGNMSSAPVFNTAVPQTFTQIGTMVGTNNKGELFIYKLGPVFLAGTASITISLSGASGCVAGAVAFSGVLSVGTQVSNSCNASCTSPASVTGITSPGTGGVVYSALSADLPTAASAGSGQTVEWNTNNTKILGAGGVQGPSTSASWTYTGAANGWALMAVPLTPLVSTAVTLGSFTATAYAAGNLIEIKTVREVSNLGFNIYREHNGQRVRVNPSLIAGSALLMRGALPQHSVKTYAWIDSSPGGNSAYWLEDVDIDGTRTLQGPVAPQIATAFESASEKIPVPLLEQLHSAATDALQSDISRPVENALKEFEPTSSQRQRQFELAAHPAVKIFVEREGWHRLTQPELAQAGLDPNVDPTLLHLYAEAVEQPIEITGASKGLGGFGPQAALQFYGTGIDTQYSGTRVYWLVAGEWPGQRIRQLPESTGSNLAPASFLTTVELVPKTTYFAALTTSDGNNFFGALVSSTPVEQTLQLPHLDQSAPEPARLEVLLQGVILGLQHSVAIALNGTTLGNLTFTGQAKGTFDVSVPPGLLLEGNNAVSLTAQGGEYDTSLVQSIRITYPHSYVADSDRLKFTGRAGDELRVTGFSSASVVVLDISDPDHPVALTPRITADADSKPAQYKLLVQVPWSTTAPAAPVRHTLLALAADQVYSAAGIRPNHPSHWHRAQTGSEIVMVSHPDFVDALRPLVRAHQAQGNSVAVVRTDELYDEFNFGERSPRAIRDFLYTATKLWATAPRYLLLNGRASVDPRNYLGFGHLDFVPTKIVPTTSLMTASDDWFSDFNDAGMPTIATGRFPVGTEDEATLVAGKVAMYEGQSTNGSWTSQALMVADVDDTENFTRDSQAVQSQLPSALQVTDIFANKVSPTTARQEIVAAINAGKLFVVYLGHGSEEQWSGEDLLDNTNAASMTNGTFLPVFLMLDCLNGLFQDVYEDPLAVKLMLAPHGGAVAVLSSSGLNQPAPQTRLGELIVHKGFGPSRPTLGDAILDAKSGIDDLGVRKTYNLLGDPAMHVKGTMPTSPAQPSR